MTKDTHHDHYNEDGKEDPVAKSWVQEKGLTCHGRDDEQRWKNLRVFDQVKSHRNSCGWF
jgi:hypothetical protein